MAPLRHPAEPAISITILNMIKSYVRYRGDYMLANKGSQSKRGIGTARLWLIGFWWMKVKDKKTVYTGRK